MKTDFPRPFVAWLCTAVVLGALPWFINLVVQWLSSNVTMIAIFHVTDLMYFVITVNATFVLDLLGREPRPTNARVMWLMMSLVFIIMAALLIGFVSYLAANPPPASGQFAATMNRLIGFSIALCIAALLATSWAQIRTLDTADDVATDAQPNADRRPGV